MVSDCLRILPTGDAAVLTVTVRDGHCADASQAPRKSQGGAALASASVYVGYNSRVLAVPFVIVRETPVRWRAVVIAVTASAWLLAAAVTVHAGGGSDDPDALYAQRENLESALRAADIWSAQLVRSPEDFEVACKVARARHWLGEVLPRDQRASHLEQGIAAAQRAIALAPDRPDGHFWLGANMGAYAGVSLMRAFRYRTAIRQAFEAALARDPAFARGGAYCALGKYFNMVPAMFGGNKRRSEELLQRCLSFDPQSVVGRYYLGQTLVALDRPEDARRSLEATIHAPCDADYVPECRIWKRRAQNLLRRLDGGSR